MPSLKVSSHKENFWVYLALTRLILDYKTHCDRIKPRTHDETIHGRSFSLIWLDWKPYKWQKNMS